MKKFLFAVSVGLAGLGLAVTASATFIDFDDGQPNGSAVGAFYAGLGVTFTDAAWSDNFSLAGTSGAQGIASISSGFNPQQASPIGASFSSTMSSVTLRGIDVGGDGYRLKAYNAANLLIDNQVVFGSGSGVGSFFDLTVTGAIARIEFSQDNNGLAGSDGMLFDNMTFSASPVPEPVTMGLAGVALVTAARRKLRKTA